MFSLFMMSSISAPNHSQMGRFKLLQIYTLRLLAPALLFLFASPSAAESQRGIPGSKSGNYAQQYEQSILQGIRLSDVFEFNDTKTTDFGPSYGNHMLDSIH